MAGWPLPEADEPFVRQDIAIYAADPLPDPAVLRQWIAEMKGHPRGPFKRIRWFCNDGTVHPPRPYACSERGGGVQHGEWSDQVKRLRAHGYSIANVLADVPPESFTRTPGWDNRLKQMILEQFLIEADDGWIFRKARYYRGALQAENETANALGILKILLSESAWRTDNFLVLREAVRFMPHGRNKAPLTEMRQLASTLAEKDPDFASLRTKLHVRPEAGDALEVRRYAARQGKIEILTDYEQQAQLIEEVFRPRRTVEALRFTATAVKDRDLARRLRAYSAQLGPNQPVAVRQVAAGEALALIRDRLSDAGNPDRMLYLLHLSLDLEQEVYELGNRAVDSLPRTSRRERLESLKATVQALYGIGLLSGRERSALANSFSALADHTVSTNRYKTELDYLERIPEWSAGHLHFHFSQAINHLSGIEPLFSLYITERLRGSPLTAMAVVLESLSAEADRLSGIRHSLFGEETSSVIHPLNPGLARGTLRFYREGDSPAKMDREGIYVLPETLAELPPVAGILTAGRGNALSHVQLLARNLGIPNVAMDPKILAKISRFEGRQVVLAVSPSGVVHLDFDGPQWQTIFRHEQRSAPSLIRPDLEKLDLKVRHFISLANLRAEDSGRIVGPKAANLGELKHLYPELVTDGLVIPFGVFRRHLDQPLESGGPSVFEWMEEQYAVIARMEDSPARTSAERHFLERLRGWFTTRDPGRQFREQLWGALYHTLGREGSYGVFVRSDTNVEDLPGFSGAGLNLTVPHVVGFENILDAILQVWASPFTQRAYGWRQAHMELPQHLYVSVLLMKSVPADKSGVMVTSDIRTGNPGWLTVAVNEGVGGAVEGQRAEELRIDRSTGKVVLLAQAAEPLKLTLRPAGGVSEVPASGRDRVLSDPEIGTLIAMAQSLPARFPGLVDTRGEQTPADIEFGFVDGRFALFQIRPFLESDRARRSSYLAGLDKELPTDQFLMVNLNEVSGGADQ